MLKNNQLLSTLSTETALKGFSPNPSSFEGFFLPKIGMTRENDVAGDIKKHRCLDSGALQEPRPVYLKVYRMPSEYSVM